jgi:hypothetical protein
MGNWYLDPDYARRNALANKYQMTLEQYDDMELQQKGCCAICGRREGHRKLAVDHDHDTGKVRSLLCTRCNTGLGFFKDSPKLLAYAMVYLEKHGKTF